MTIMHTLNKVYFFSLSKAHIQSFHQKVAILMQEAGIDQEPDTQEAFEAYQKKIEEMKAILSLSKQLEQTEVIRNARREIDTHYKYIHSVLRNLEYDQQGLDEELCQKIKHEILEIFPLKVLRLPFYEYTATLSSLCAHLESDWQSLLETLNLTEHYTTLCQQLDLLVNSTNARSEEKANKEKGQARRIIAELTGCYNLLALYVEAWSNTLSTSPTIQDRQQRTLTLLNQINEIVSSLKHSLAVASSNRRRAKNQKLSM